MVNRPNSPSTCRPVKSFHLNLFIIDWSCTLLVLQQLEQTAKQSHSIDSICNQSEAYYQKSISEKFIIGQKSITLNTVQWTSFQWEPSIRWKFDHEMHTNRMAEYYSANRESRWGAQFEPQTLSAPVMPIELSQISCTTAFFVSSSPTNLLHRL